jgi:hypothetical protein
VEGKVCALAAQSGLFVLLFIQKKSKAKRWLAADAIYEVVSVCLSSGKLILSLAPLLLSASVKCIFSSGGEQHGAALLNFIL